MVFRGFALMDRELGVAAAWLLALATSGCGGGWYEQPLPRPVSSAPVARTAGGLLAGFGRADLTPPPGVGLAGNGPEGFTSTGYRHRLYARALVLEDQRGERVALVVTDLPFVSTNLHRLVAERIAGKTGIGADRLIVSATHTHSSAGHHLGERQYNSNATRLPGYDPAVVDLLVSGISRAVLDAFQALSPAKAAWGFQTTKGFTRNRSYRAFCANPESVRPPCPDETGEPTASLAPRAVDTVWSILRIDRSVGGGPFRPSGAYSVFAMHGTANPSATTILDGDIHAVVERRLERRIDQLNGDPEAFVPRAFHLFANSNEGDVSPNRPLPATQCPLPKHNPPEFAGPRESARPWDWKDAPATALQMCIHQARRYIVDAGTAMGDLAFEQFQSLAPSLRSDLTIARAFTTIRLPGRNGLCPKAVIGTSTAAGASDVPTRVVGWNLLGVIPAGFEQGGAAIKRPPAGCHGEKQPLLGPLQSAVIVGEHGFPDVAQLAAIRIGNVVLGAVPGEATTTAGRAFKEALVAGADPNGTRSLRAVIVGLANGFLQYITTRAEYAEQTYEGGSTLYGPRTAEVLAEEFRALGKELDRAWPGSPSAEVSPITAFPGEPRPIMPTETATPRLIGSPFLFAQECSAARSGGGGVYGDTLRVLWIDEPPGRLVPADGQVLALEEQMEAGWRSVVWDDDPEVVVEAVRPIARQGYLWRATISRPLRGKSLRLRLLPRARTGFQGVESDPFIACAEKLRTGER